MLMTLATGIPAAPAHAHTRGHVRKLGACACPSSLTPAAHPVLMEPNTFTLIHTLKQFCIQISSVCIIGKLRPRKRYWFRGQYVGRTQKKSRDSSILGQSSIPAIRVSLEMKDPKMQHLGVLEIDCATGHHERVIKEEETL